MPMTYRCDFCGEEVDDTRVTIGGGRITCHNCIEEGRSDVCVSCGDVLPRDEAYQLDHLPDSYCEECFNDRYQWCDHCQEYHTRDSECFLEDDLSLENEFFSKG